MEQLTEKSVADVNGVSLEECRVFLREYLENFVAKNRDRSPDQLRVFFL